MPEARSTDSRLDKFAARAKKIARVTPDRVIREGDTAEEIIKLTQTNLRFYFWRRSGTYRPFVDANYRRELANADTTAALAFSGLANSDFKVQGIGVPLNMYSGRLGMTFVTRLGNATLTYEFKQAPGQRRQTLGLRVRFK